ncbi:MAG: hypothetical protein AAB304_06305 [Pseudomonadota bacterium]
MSEILYFLLVLGFLLSLYQGYRGFMFQWLRPDAPFKGWPKPRKLFLLALADGLTYFVTSASGFGSLVLCWEISIRISDPAKIEVGAAALLGFLAVYGILGVTGKMPHLIDRGKLSPPSLGGGS